MYHHFCLLKFPAQIENYRRVLAFPFLASVEYDSIWKKCRVCLSVNDPSLPNDHIMTEDFTRRFRDEFFCGW